MAGRSKIRRKELLQEMPQFVAKPKLYRWIAF
jgi:hypothetical protein